MTTPLFTIIFGPTASGKTELAYTLAETQGADILSFDSRHVYREMSIVTGKDLPPPNAPFQVFGLNLVNPDEEFSIRHYYEYAKQIIEEHRQARKPLILVGGSWQYASVIISPPPSLLAVKNYEQRQELETASLEELQQLAQDKNPERWQSMNSSDQANPRRLIRLLEYTDPVEEALPALLQKDEYTLEILNPDIEVLEQRIRARIDKRLEQGALEETKLLMDKYPNWKMPSFSSTGYGYLRQHLEGTISLEEAKKLWWFQERKYAKRQKTWIKKIQATQQVV